MPIGTSDGKTYESEFHMYADMPMDLSGEDTKTEIESLHDSSNLPYLNVPDSLPAGTPVYEINKPRDNNSYLEPVHPDKLGADFILNALKELRPEYTKEPPIKDISTGTVGKVPSTQVDPVLAATGAVMDLAGPIGPKAAAVGASKLAIFAGLGAKNIDRNMLREAQYMAMKGKSEEEIWKATGFFKGADDRWRFEIPDTNAKIADRDIYYNKIYKLSDILEHPELYDNYPQLRDVPIAVDKRLKPGTAYASSDAIVLGPHTLEDPRVLLHEIQHHVQNTEGFARGGSPAKEYTLRFDKPLKELTAEAENLLQKDSYTPAEMDRLAYLRKVFEIASKRDKEAPRQVYENYKRLAGEVEARNVETRSRDEYRYIINQEDSLEMVPVTKVIPRDTEDVPRELQHISNHPTLATPYGYGDPRVPPTD